MKLKNQTHRLGLFDDMNFGIHDIMKLKNQTHKNDKIYI